MLSYVASLFGRLAGPCFKTHDSEGGQDHINIKTLQTI